jgi:hypothetical protein
MLNRYQKLEYVSGSNRRPKEHHNQDNFCYTLSRLRAKPSQLTSTLLSLGISMPLPIADSLPSEAAGTWKACRYHRSTSKAAFLMIVSKPARLLGGWRSR